MYILLRMPPFELLRVVAEIEPPLNHAACASLHGHAGRHMPHTQCLSHVKVMVLLRHNLRQIAHVGQVETPQIASSVLVFGVPNGRDGRDGGRGG